MKQLLSYQGFVAAAVVVVPATLIQEDLRQTRKSAKELLSILDLCQARLVTGVVMPQLQVTTWGRIALRTLI